MDFDTAKSLMDEVLEIDRLMAKLAYSLNELEEPERTALKRGLGYTMAEMYDRLIVPISGPYPTLNPLNQKAEK